MRGDSEDPVGGWMSLASRLRRDQATVWPEEEEEVEASLSASEAFCWLRCDASKRTRLLDSGWV